MLLVPGAGIEPALPQREQDFKSCVSTSSTIRATLLKKQEERWKPISERKTRLELATPTLARLCSTN